MNEKIIEFSKGAKNIFFENAEMEKIATGYIFTEGAAWSKKENALYFTDFPENKIYKWKENEDVICFSENSNRAIGLFIDKNENIFSAESSKHRIAIVNENGSEPIATEFQGKRFNSPNDITVSRLGETKEIFFTDPFSDALGLPSEIGFNGVYRKKEGKEVQLVSKKLGRPNGIALSSDEKFLYVNDTDLQQIFVTEVDGNEDLEVFATLDTSHGEGAPDGMKVDCAGNVWVTGPSGIWVISPDGNPIAILKCPEYVGNFCFGGEDLKTLFITASTSVYRIKIRIAGSY